MKTLVGAIRWDAWGTQDIGPQVRATLSLQRFHFRLPFYAKIIGNDNIFIPPYSQELIDKEIVYAKNAGIDYWAFCWYPHTVEGGLDSARKLYQSSAHKNDIKWCPILCVSRFNLETDGKTLVEEMKEENYQRVDNNRPLVYFFGVDKNLEKGLRKLCREANVENPFIVKLSWYAPDEDYEGFDGISAYVIVTKTHGALYSEFIKGAEKRWDEMTSVGLPLIPTVSTGWDKRPRYYHPVSWEFKATNTYPTNYVYQGTSDEIATHLDHAMTWAEKHSNESPVNSVLIYAWNENDEGGWIIPTLKEMEDYGHPVRLDAIKRVIKKHNRGNKS